MLEIGSWAPQALEKLKKEINAVTGQKEKAMARPVYAVICDFCDQNEEFAQAVVQGGSFADCMKKVAAGVGQSISDLDAYKKAVQFYFPGAEVRMQLTIDLIGKAAGKDKLKEQTKSVAESAPSLVLNLADYF